MKPQRFCSSRLTRHRISSGLLLLFFIFLPTPSSSSSFSAAAAAASASDAPTSTTDAITADPEFRNITDMAGRTVLLKGEIHRVIPTFKPVTLCLLSLGYQDRMVGIDTHSKRDPLTRTIFPEVSRLTGVGTKSIGINLETLVGLQPELVILYSQKDGLDLANRLEKMGIAAIIILPENMEMIRQSLTIMARAIGGGPGTSHAAQVMDDALSLVSRRMASLAPENRKTAYFASPRHLFSTATGDMLQDDILTRAGLINVAHDLSGYFPDISPEQFLRWNPQMIFISRSLPPTALSALRDHPPLQQVDAVKNNNIHRFPSSLAPWDFPSPLSALATLWVARTAYPDRFSDIDMMAYADRFHEALFQRSLSDMDGCLEDRVPPDHYH